MLEHLKEAVVEYALEAEKMGLCRHRSGNFSMRDKASGLVCVTPSGVDRSVMQPADVVVMDMEAHVVEALTGLRPTSEALMHLAAYAARPDIAAAAHTHSKFALSFAVLGKPIPAIVSELAHLGCRKGYIPVASYGRQGSRELAASIKVPLAGSDAMLMTSHGVFTVDEKSLSDAVLKAAYVEEIAEVYYHALLLNGGKEPPTLPLEDLTLQYPKEIIQG